jgi:16S rRNA processing protein RimM
MPSAPPGWLHAGKVGRPHGLDGSFHVVEANAPLLAPGRIVLVDGEARAIVRRAGTDARPVIRLEGHDDRAAAQALTGSELLAARSEAPELGEDEWWAADLEGCSVRDGGREVGVVRRLLALPSCEVLEVARSGNGEELLVPLVSDAVRAVDIERRLIDVDLRFLGEED